MKKEKFIPLDKQSKKRRKEADRAKRADWGLVNPVTRVVKDKTKYDRNRVKRQKEDFQ